MNKVHFSNSVPLQEEAQVVDNVMNGQNVSFKTFIQQVLRQIIDIILTMRSLQTLFTVPASNHLLRRRDGGRLHRVRGDRDHQETPSRVF